MEVIGLLDTVEGLLIKDRMVFAPLDVVDGPEAMDRIHHFTCRRRIITVHEPIVRATHTLLEIHHCWALRNPADLMKECFRHQACLQWVYCLQQPCHHLSSPVYTYLHHHLRHRNRSLHLRQYLQLLCRIHRRRYLEPEVQCTSKCLLLLRYSCTFNFIL
ncbi:hypothetical protein ANCCAN_09010 [Ancylostoma caninum]|uniref:Uncharacterized protein n=1 Tax=Ancylostoma caninum TaxID=29170 RepID=A0A368GKT3_ANCCA|nr:hypothetical protein ANCCAN_09010 [Ancylostoma caninum]